MAIFGSAISKIRKGLTATREALIGGAGDVVNFLRGRRIDAAMLEELEARLIRADLGVKAARRVSLLRRLTQYLQSYTQALLIRTFSSVMHRPSAEKLWQQPAMEEVVLPILPG